MKEDPPAADPVWGSFFLEARWSPSPLRPGAGEVRLCADRKGDIRPLSGHAEFREKWNRKYPNILKSWDKNWAELTSFFGYPNKIRKIIYTTSAVEGHHRRARKFTKTKAIFPTDDSIRKAIYMSTKEISQKWTMPVWDWGLAYAKITIF